MDISEVPDGMDPSRTYKIKMRFHSTSRQDCSGAYKVIHYVDADRMFPVVYAIMECESAENWEWFMKCMHKFIGEPEGLAICTDAGKGLDAVKTMFQNSEHRECMRHLVTNFKKRFHGRVFDLNLWPAAYAWTPEKHDEHMNNMVTAIPDVEHYLTVSHPNVWMRSKFNEKCKVDYVTNNLAESFNNWIKKYKGMHLPDLADKLRQKMMVKMAQRRAVGSKLKGVTLPHIVLELNAKSHKLNYDIIRCGEHRAELTGKHWTFTRELEDFRHIVDLNDKTCTCREWQITNKPCLHAIAFITSLRDEPWDNYVDNYYSVEKFRATYEGMVPALTDKKQWPKSDHGFFMHPPLLARVAGRLRTLRIKASHEPDASKKRRGNAHQCKICKAYGHHWQTCKEGDPKAKAALAEIAAKAKEEKKQKAKAKALAGGAPPRKRRKSSDSVTSKFSVHGSNDLEAPPNVLPLPPPSSVEASAIASSSQAQVKPKKARSKDKVQAATKLKGKTTSKKVKANAKKTTMATPTKKALPATLPDSPASNTRSKRKLMVDS